MQPIYAGFFASFVHHRVSRYGSQSIKMMSDGDIDDCDGLFDRLILIGGPLAPENSYENI